MSKSDSMELELLWVALQEERQVVAMKNAVIQSLQDNLLRAEEEIQQLKFHRNLVDHDEIGSTSPPTSEGNEGAEFVMTVLQDAELLARDEIQRCWFDGMSWMVKLSELNAELRSTTLFAVKQLEESNRLKTQAASQEQMMESLSQSAMLLTNYVQLQNKEYFGRMVELSFMAELQNEKSRWVAERGSLLEAWTDETSQLAGKYQTCQKDFEALENTLKDLFLGVASSDQVLHRVLIFEEFAQASRAAASKLKMESVSSSQMSWLTSTIELFAEYVCCKSEMGFSDISECLKKKMNVQSVKDLLTVPIKHVGELSIEKERANVAKIEQLEERVLQKTRIIAFNTRHIEELEEKIKVLQGKLAGVNAKSIEIDVVESTSGGSKKSDSSTEMLDLRKQLIAQARLLADLEKLETEQKQNQVVVNVGVSMLDAAEKYMNLLLSWSQAYHDELEEIMCGEGATLEQKINIRKMWDNSVEKFSTERNVPAEKYSMENIPSVWLQAKHYLNIQLLEIHNSLFPLVAYFAPQRKKNVDVQRIQMAEGALMLSEAQRDQAAMTAHWIHTECSNAVRTMSGLLNRMQEATKIEDAKIHEEDHVEPPVDNRVKEVALTTSSSDFHLMCDRFLDRVSMMHQQLISSEAEVAQLKSQVRSNVISVNEYQSVMDSTSLTQCVEREISDGIIVALREHLREERSTALGSIRLLTNENQTRNDELRFMQRQLSESQLSGHAAIFMAQYMFHAFEIMHENFTEQVRGRLIQAYLTLLPSPAEVSILLAGVHVQLGAVLSEAYDSMYVLFADIGDQFNNLVQTRNFYQSEVLRMADEIVQLTSERRLERASTAFLEEHVKDNLILCFSESCDAFSTLFIEVSAELRKSVQDQVGALAIATQLEEAQQERVTTLENLQKENEDNYLNLVAAQETMQQMETDIQRKRKELKSIENDRDSLQESNSLFQSKAQESGKEQELLASLLHAEKQAHLLCKSREEGYVREMTDLRGKLYGAENEVKQLAETVEREKEAHRATIRSFAER